MFHGHSSVKVGVLAPGLRCNVEPLDLEPLVYRHFYGLREWAEVVATPCVRAARLPDW
jgi:hypothetical protein